MNILKNWWSKLFRSRQERDLDQTEQPVLCGFQNGQLMEISNEREQQGAADHKATEEKLRLNAELVVREMTQHAGFQLGFNGESVDWIDGFIERQRAREGFDAESEGGLVNVLGSFVGECMCHELGGVWKQQPDGSLSVEFSDGNGAFPFNKVAKQFANGSDDSIYSFYQSAAVLFASGLQIRGE